MKCAGSVITEDGRSHSDAKVRITMAKNALNKGKNFATNGSSRTLQKENGKIIGVAGCVVWMSDSSCNIVTR